MPDSSPWAAPVAQIVVNGLVRREPGTRGGRSRLVTYRACRRALLKLGDPVVRYPFEGRVLRLPFSHDLPLIRAFHPHYMTNLSRLVGSVLGKYPALSVVDIGANVGDTALAIRSLAAVPILCIEGDSLFFDLLRTNTADLPEVFCEHAFLSHTAAPIAGTLEMNAGTAHLVEGRPATSLSATTLAALLHKQPAFADARLIKLDTDGFDTAILHGALDLLSQHRPVLFFEYDPFAFGRYGFDGVRIFAGLLEAGYEHALVWENTGDYLLSAALADRRTLADLHHFFSGRGGSRYCDIAVFSADDEDIFSIVRTREIDFFSNHRR